MRTLHMFRLAPAGLLVATAAAAAADWPQWRGPNRDGRSPETGLLKSWPEGGPRRLFSAAGFGTGFSSLAVTGGRIYTLGDLADGQFVLAALESDGTMVWRARLGPIFEHEYPGPRSTPTVAGGRVYALGTEGDLLCLEEASGKELWRRNILEDFGGRQMRYAGTMVSMTRGRRASSSKSFRSSEMHRVRTSSVTCVPFHTSR